MFMVARNLTTHPIQPLQYSNVTDGLIHYYPLNGTTLDMVGGEHFTEEGTLYIKDDTFGVVLYGNDTTPHYSYNTTLTQNSEMFKGPYSISLWCYSDSSGLGTNTYDSYIVSYVGDDGNIPRLYIGKYRRDDSFMVQIYDESGTQLCGYFSPSPIDVDTWFHIGVTVTDSSIKIYKDGIMIHESTFTRTYPTTVQSDYMVFGNDHYFGNFRNNILNGAMENIRFYNRELSQTEIQEIISYEMNNRSIVVDDGLKVYLPLITVTGSEDNTELQNVTTEIGNLIYNNNGVTLGVDEYISTGYVPSSQFYTYSLWVQSSSLIGQYDALIGDFDINVGNNGTNIQLEGDDPTNVKFRVGYGYGSNSSSILTSNSYDITTRKHICSTINGDTGLVRIFIDGQLVDETNLPVGTISNGTNILYVGNIPYYVGTNAFNFDGNVAYTRYYDRILSAEEVSIIYDTESGYFV